MEVAPSSPGSGVAQYPVAPDTHCASPEAVDFLSSFFVAKNSHDVGATMRHFSPEMLTYTDSTLGWPFDGFDVLEGVLGQYMPQWPASALSYPTRILGDADSMVVAFTDTPEMFGGELRIIGAIDTKDGKIVRWVDYWDSISFDDDKYAQIRTPAESFPADFKEGMIGVSAAPAMVEIATGLQAAWAAGEAEAAAELLSYDAVYEDMALRAQVQGRADIEGYLSRALGRAPFGSGSKLRHIVGGETGGGFEWFAVPGSMPGGGITALEIDGEGRISRITSVYDSRQLSESVRRSLVLKSIGLE